MRVVACEWNSRPALLALIRDESASYYDDRSEAWQEGDRGEEHAERVEVLTELVNGLEDLSF